MERDYTPAELVAERAYNLELHRVDAWIEQAKRTWDQEHRTEAHWQKDWREDYNRGVNAEHYDSRNHGHQNAREDWDLGKNEARERQVWDQLRTAGVVSEHVWETYSSAQERYPYRIAEFAAEEKKKEVQERLELRSPEMAARGWGQSWSEQEHTQDRGRHQ